MSPPPPGEERENYCKGVGFFSFAIGPALLLAWRLGGEWDDHGDCRNVRKRRGASPREDGEVVATRVASV